MIVSTFQRRPIGTEFLLNLVHTSLALINFEFEVDFDLTVLFNRSMPVSFLSSKHTITFQSINDFNSDIAAASPSLFTNRLDCRSIDDDGASTTQDDRAQSRTEQPPQRDDSQEQPPPPPPPLPTVSHQFQNQHVLPPLSHNLHPTNHLPRAPLPTISPPHPPPLTLTPTLLSRHHLPLHRAPPSRHPKDARKRRGRSRCPKLWGICYRRSG